MLTEGRIIQALDKFDQHDDRLGREVYKNVSRKAQDLVDHIKTQTGKGEPSNSLLKGISRKAEDMKDSIKDAIQDHGPGVAAGAGLLGAGLAARKYLTSKKQK